MNYALIKDYFERWRHTRGYGVHSPLAYRIVKDCIHPDRKYAFYSDAYLDFEYNEERKALRHARMAIRLINLLRPHSIWYPNGDKRLCTALKMSFPNIHLASQKNCPKNIDFIICNGNDDFSGMWHKMDSMQECAMVVYGKELDNLEGATLILSARNFTIVIRRIGMDFTAYSL